jgi:hypothetical protein
MDAEFPRDRRTPALADRRRDLRVHLVLVRIRHATNLIWHPLT